ncbi:MAG: DNA translocase FtsK [Prevotellaceae bacterium]|jgi:S-DNA-T family DNA segregation ATPase FtsK/SpoIIIE|nr:DNA translocase FtsK [Prevotellaceae bacterium]
MAKKKNTGKQVPPTEEQYRRSDNLRFIGGVLALLFALFTLIVLGLYIFRWGAYQSGAQTSPFIGKLGYSWANLLMGEYFGLASFGIPFLFGLWGLHLLRMRIACFYKIILAALTGCILFSVLLGFVFGHLMPSLKGLTGKGLGGITGDMVSGWLIQVIGIAGTALLLLLLIITWGVFISPKFIPWLRRLFHVKKKNRKPEKEDVSGGEPQPPVPDDKESKDDDGGFEIHRPGDDTSENSGDNHSGDPAPAGGLPPGITDSTEDGGFFEGESELYDPTKELSHYKRPPVDLLEDHKGKGAMPTDEELERNKDKIVTVLQNFNIGIDKIIATIGPTVTLYEIVPKAGIRIASIKRLEDDIALNLAALGIRIIAPIPGKGTVGIEVPNEHPNIVSMLSVVKSAEFNEAQYDLPVVLGKKIDNAIYTFDLAKMPHLLVAGATGQGKSVGLNAILTSLLYRKHPSELKLVLVDPKRVELSLYTKLEQHFLAKLPDSDDAIITDTQKVVYTLKSLCIEMDERYQLLQWAQVRNIKEYNERFVNRRLNPLKGHRYMPFIVVVIDEFADLIMTAGREVEEPIARLAQLARAVGMHLVIATQRPTTNIITGLIKANFPARIAFRVISGIDSRTILDTTGANQLIGRGDMLVSTGNEMIRVQCAFVDTSEVERICDFIGRQQGFGEAFPLPEYKGEENNSNAGKVDLSKRDDLFADAARIIVQSQQGSTSLIQRKLELGYNRAGRLMDQLEAAGIVGPPEGSKARQVLISDFITLDAKLAAMEA